MRLSFLITFTGGVLGLIGSSSIAEALVRWDSRNPEYSHSRRVSSKEKMPTDATAFYLRGLDRFKAEDYRGALADFNESLRLRKQGSIFLYLGPGMSGGPIFDGNGRVIGIHGRAAGNADMGKVGINLGIPIHLFLQNVPQGKLNLKSIGSAE
jgi:hypothetical protein